tara:strand:- start:198 stop:566 length:369 start_codon:yes stop_codon:yes gene_type:complete
MIISLHTKTLIDDSFRLGYLFSVLIFDLEKIMGLIEKKDFKNLLIFLEIDFIVKFISLESFFENLYKTQGISEGDDLIHIKTFCKDSTLMLQNTIFELKKMNNLTEENIFLIKKLLKNMTDF